MFIRIFITSKVQMAGIHASGIFSGYITFVILLLNDVDMILLDKIRSIQDDRAIDQT